MAKRKKSKADPKKIVSIVLIAEVLLAILFWILKPECEPCPADTYCPPCISIYQVAIVWIGVVIAAAALGYSIYDSIKKNKR
ncbi:MAG TPA: hypothetical protein PKM63_03185 [Panacibacter sp.]|nr:hypothetical protein [Panacibacter sp.]HNP43262.1 hypothetical protein [Panacibacter sp.]